MVNLKLKVSPCARSLLLKVDPLVLNTVWTISDLFVQMTVLPTGIVTVAGLKPEFWMVTDFVTDFDAGVGGGRGVGLALGVGVGCSVGVAVGARAVVAVGLTWTAGCDGDVVVFDDEPLRLPSVTKTP